MTSAWRKASGSVIAITIAAMATPAYADVVVGPRFSYYFDNGNLRTSGIAGGEADQGGLVDQSGVERAEELFPGQVEFQSRQEGQGVVADQVVIPMIGAMINFGNDRDRFTITTMYGDGSGSLSQTQSISRSIRIQEETAVDFGTAVVEADFAYDRYDAELTWQRRTSETFALVGGLRYERLERRGPGTVGIGVTANVDNLLRNRLADAEGQERPPPFVDQGIARGPIVESASLETFSGRLGVTAFVPFSRNGVAFFNGMVHGSYQPGYTSNTDFIDPQGATIFTQADPLPSETSIGSDFAVGAQFTLTSNMALDMRYRAILFFPLLGNQSFSDARVNHGINLGVSFRL